MKYKVVQFINGVARIVTTNDVSQYQDNKVDCFVNPILTHLKGVPPELWEVQNSQIVAIKDEARKQDRIKALHLEAEMIASPKGKSQFEMIFEDVKSIHKSVESLTHQIKDEAETLAETREWILANVINQTKQTLVFEDEIKAIKRQHKKHLNRLVLTIAIIFLTIFLIVYLGGF